jgi:hypothetical protein
MLGATKLHVWILKLLVARCVFWGLLQLSFGAACRSTVMGLAPLDLQMKCSESNVL